MDGDNDDGVGFKRPPVSGQFKKGQSGNPNGRPRKAKTEAPVYYPAAEPTRSIWREEALRSISLREGDKMVEMPLTQAVIRSTGVAAAKGRPMAQRTYLAYALAEDARFRIERRESFDFWLGYQREKLAVIEKCRARGVEPPDFLPHPEDIEFDYLSLDVKFIGAVNDEERRREERLVAHRDFALCLSFYYGEHREMPVHEPRAVGFVLVQFSLAQAKLPARLRLPDDEFDRRYWRWFHMTRKEHEAELQALARLADQPFTPLPPSKRPCLMVPASRLGLRDLPKELTVVPARRRRRAGI